MANGITVKFIGSLFDCSKFDWQNRQLNDGLPRWAHQHQIPSIAHPLTTSPPPTNRLHDGQTLRISDLINSFKTCQPHRVHGFS